MTQEHHLRPDARQAGQLLRHQQLGSDRASQDSHWTSFHLTLQNFPLASLDFRVWTLRSDTRRRARFRRCTRARCELNWNSRRQLFEGQTNHSSSCLNPCETPSTRNQAVRASDSPRLPLRPPSASLEPEHSRPLPVFPESPWCLASTRTRRWLHHSAQAVHG